MKGGMSKVKKDVWYGPADYQIKVKGNLGNQWSDWFASMKIESEGAFSTITGRVSDQSALHGLLLRIRDMGLPLISLQRIKSKKQIIRKETENE